MNFQEYQVVVEVLDKAGVVAADQALIKLTANANKCQTMLTMNKQNKKPW